MHMRACMEVGGHTFKVDHVTTADLLPLLQLSCCVVIVAIATMVVVIALSLYCHCGLTMVGMPASPSVRRL